ncbi:MAG: TRAP transporter large permease, partial [Thermoanaerobaculia bacterium]
VSGGLARASWDFLAEERRFGSTFGPDLPVWVALLVLPLSFALIAWRLGRGAGDGWGLRVGGLAAAVAGWWLAGTELLAGLPAWPGLVLLLVATVAGLPIFAAIGGAAILLFLADGVPAAAVPLETYSLNVSATLPAIPLFTLAGFLLAEGTTSKRLLRLFRAWVGWLPGGTAIVCAFVCAFFTVLTGGSGVTILALGALLFAALREEGYGERFSLGLLTSSGALGLLWPPALPLILYAVVAGVAVDDLFLAGIVPGTLLVALVALWGVMTARRRSTRRQEFIWAEARAALWGAKWELLLPPFILLAVFGGFATLVEASALTVLYCFLVQAVAHRDLSLRRDLPRVLKHCVVLLGGVLVILGVAKGFTNYLVDAQVASMLVDWTQTHIGSRLLFLLALNLVLLLVGCLMDIFSAIVVVVPLILPLAAAFGVDPIHLGILFVANLELGYLTPPVGLNLFLASYRFDRPLLEVARSVLPALLLLALGVLLITYVPAMTLWLPGLFAD